MYVEYKNGKIPPYDVGKKKNQKKNFVVVGAL